LSAYVGEIDETAQHWTYGVPRNGYSYRFIEDPAVQTHECAFLAEMDYASGALREIQYWLHAEAAKCGFAIDPGEPKEKDCMLYKKGSKRWLLAGQDGGGVAFVKAIFRAAHSHETMAKLYRRFPDTFRHNCGSSCGPNVKPSCVMRIEFKIDGDLRRCCAYNSFYFNSPSPDDMRMILDMFKLENRIR
jgi:hypothetical protein